MLRWKGPTPLGFNFQCHGQVITICPESERMSYFITISITFKQIKSRAATIKVSNFSNQIKTTIVSDFILKLWINQANGEESFNTLWAKSTRIEVEGNVKIMYTYVEFFFHRAILLMKKFMFKHHFTFDFREQTKNGFLQNN